MCDCPPWGLFFASWGCVSLFEKKGKKLDSGCKIGDNMQDTRNMMLSVVKVSTCVFRLAVHKFRISNWAWM